MLVGLAKKQKMISGCKKIILTAGKEVSPLLTPTICAVVSILWAT
tara:strand:- start:411 stop:545 length:135 start_codon:yes stop_codon:yes gene_type:complete